MVVHPYNHSTWTVVGGSLGFNGHPACLVNSQSMRDSVFALALCTCLPRASQLGLLTMTHLPRREKKDIRPALDFLSLLQVISRQCCINCTWPWESQEVLMDIGWGRQTEGGSIYAAPGESSFRLCAKLPVLLLEDHPCTVYNHPPPMLV